MPKRWNTVTLELPECWNTGTLIPECWNTGMLIPECWNTGTLEAPSVSEGALALILNP
jgi:hypothetical protein